MDVAQIDEFLQEDAVNEGEDWSIECRSTAVNQQWVAKWVNPNGLEVPIMTNGSCDSTTLSQFVTVREGTEMIEGDTKKFQELTLHLCNVKESFGGNYICKIEGGDERAVFLQVGSGGEEGESDSGGNLGGGDLAGIIAATVVIVVILLSIGVLIVLLAIVMVHSRGKYHREFDTRSVEDVDSKQGEPQDTEPELVIPFGAPSGKGTGLELDVDGKWKYPADRLVFANVLGSGQFGEVRKVLAPGILSRAPHKSLAAAKTVKGVCCTRVSDVWVGGCCVSVWVLVHPSVCWCVYGLAV